MLICTFTVLPAMAQTSSFPSGLTITTEENRYTRGETVKILGQVAGLAGGSNTILLTIYAPDNTILQATKTDVRAGLFQYSFQLGNTAMPGTWRIVANYDVHQQTATFSVLDNGLFDRVVLRPPTLTDIAGNEVLPEAQQSSREYIISIEVVSDEVDSSQQLVLITQVTDPSGFSTMVSVTLASLQPSQTFSHDTRWKPAESGAHTIDVFVWNELGAPIPLDEKQSVTFMLV
jgi:hypothetical protein